mgnify:CR=1 FL=1|jgi:uncharacterized protein (TIGR00255 family)
MALSMTGCGAGVATDGPSTCRIELRCVNNRFLKLSLRSREGFLALESQIEAAIRKRVRRGAIQMTLDVAGPAAPAARTLDQAQLEAYLGQLEHFCSGHDLPVPKSIDGLLSLPGILAESLPAKEAIDGTWPLIARALDAALDGLDAMRRAEGDAMARDMRQTCKEIVALVAKIRDRVPAVLEEHRARLHERVGKLLEARGVTLSDADLAREIALVAERSDIAEELVRLESHVDQFDRLLDEESPGRSLDFLAQELAREANTIASKSLDVGIAHAVVDLKTQIERLRELVQNVE